MNSKGTKEPLAQRRGFYIALYCVLAALLVLAAVISYNNYTAVTRARELRAQMEAEEAREASASQVGSYLTQANKAASRPTPAPAPGIKPTPAPKAAPAAPKPAPPQTPGAKPGNRTSGVAPAAGGQAKAGTAAAEPAMPQNETAEQPAEAGPETAAAPGPAEDTRVTAAPDPVFEVFSEGDAMNWPVLGEVVMDFSDEHVIYDRTLEQYRTNDVLCISTEIGTPVRAAAGGVVKSVTPNSRELGNMVVIDHGNGWESTYGQLQDSVLVKAGEAVASGQVIGGVGSPTLYYVLLGNHLGFSVSHDAACLDPKTLLE